VTNLRVRYLAKGKSDCCYDKRQQNGNSDHTCDVSRSQAGSINKRVFRRRIGDWTLRAPNFSCGRTES
jgi:hypothetical protein